MTAAVGHGISPLVLSAGVWDIPATANVYVSAPVRDDCRGDGWSQLNPYWSAMTPPDGRLRRCGPSLTGNAGRDAGRLRRPLGHQASGADHAGLGEEPAGDRISAVRPRIIAWLEQELNDLDEGLRQTLRRSPVWREKDDLLRTVPGVGEQVSLTLLAYLPTLDRRQSPGGSGPLPAPCGASGPSGEGAPEYEPFCIWERWWPAATTRSSATSTRSCWQPGKKVALVACMRKLLVILNSMLKHGSTWCDMTRQKSLISIDIQDSCWSAILRTGGSSLWAFAGKCGRDAPAGRSDTGGFMRPSPLGSSVRPDIARRGAAPGPESGRFR